MLVYYGFFGVHLLEFFIEVLVGVRTPLKIGPVSREEDGQTDSRGTISDNDDLFELRTGTGWHFVL